MAKHTSGLWEQSGCSVYRKDTAKPICLMSGPAEQEEREANARLIAAAPELLERLEITNTAIQAGIDADVFTLEVKMTLEAVMKYNKQAIAKAEQG